MPPEDTPAGNNSIPVSEAPQLLTHFATFLTLAIHSLLYHRSLYPPNTFLTARAYNLPVQQSRHPGVCRWVNDAVAAVVAQLQIAAVDRVVFVVHQGGNGGDRKAGKGNGQQAEKKSFVVLERWIFDVAEFPEWPSTGPGEAEEEGDDSGGDGHDGDRNTEDADEEAAEHDDMDDIEDDVEEDSIVWDDINESLRGALGRLANTAEKMPHLPEGCPFTLAIELRDEASPPIGHPQPWIPTQPNLQPRSSRRPSARRREPASKTASTTPIRSVQAGPLFFECWVEQNTAIGSDKQQHQQQPPTLQLSRSSRNAKSAAASSKNVTFQS